MGKLSWREIAAKKKKEQIDSVPQEWLINLPSKNQLNVLAIPRECGLLTSEELEITESPVEVLLPKLASAEWTSFQVTTAFYKRAILAHQLVNCLTEIYIERALKWAKERDDYLKKTGKLMGPLHGLPVSIKDQFCIEGLDTVMGYVSWVGNKAEKNAVLVDMLLDAGAVPFVRTNVPQTLMWPECYNTVFGLTTNPANRSLTSGGSSGGEGALIALRGSPLGVGSDIAGSVRIPADFNGLYGLRPSYDRIPYQDALNSGLGQESIPSVFGPLSPTIEGVKIFFKSILDGKPWTRDPYSPRMPWNEDSYKLKEHNQGRNLVFGMLWNDTQTMPHPPIQRAMQITRDALIAAGHKVIDWSGEGHPQIYHVASMIWGADGGEDYSVATASTAEPILQSQSIYNEGDNPVPPSFRKSAKLSAYDLWQAHKEKRALRKKYLDKWQATASTTGTGRPIDAVISPVAPFAAPPHGSNTSASYTLVWNVLDYPACTFPVVTVDPEVDCRVPPHKFFNAEDQAHYENYDPKLYEGAPVGLQLAGQTQEDEAVIAMTAIVSTAIRKRLDASK